MMKRLVLCLMVVFLMPSLSFSKEIGGVTLPDSLDASGNQLILNGAGIRTLLFIKTYVAGLYLLQKSQDSDAIIQSDEPMAVKLHIVSGLVTREKMLSATNKGFEKVTKGNIEPIRERRDRFNNLFKDEIKKDDVYDLIYQPFEGVTVYKNGDKLGTIEGLDFKKALFGIWLCDTPVDTDLKKGMLGM